MRQRRAVLVTFTVVLLLAAFVVFQMLLARKSHNANAEPKNPSVSRNIQEYKHLSSPLIPKEIEEDLVEPTVPKDIEDCNKIYGKQFMSTWRNQKTTYCEDKNAELATNIFCREISYDPMYDKPEVKRHISCEFRNIMVDFSKMWFDRDVHGKYKYMDAAFGGYCKTNITSMRTLHTTPKEILMNFQSHSIPPFEQCTKWIDQPTVLILRSEVGNMYHMITDWYNMWLVPQIMGVKDYQLVFFDDKPRPAHFDKVWNKLYGNNKPIILSKEFSSGKVCFKRLVLVENGFSSNLDLPVHTMPCKSSTLIHSFIDFVLKAYGQQKVAKRVKPRITVISRKDRDGKDIMRQFQNEKEMVEALREGTDDVDITVVDLADLSVEEQITLMRKTDILYGQHGAGLANLVFLPPHGVVIEFNAVGAHYKNWAALTDKTYISFGDVRSYHRHSIPVDIKEMMQVMDVALRIARANLDRKQDCGLRCPQK